MPAVPAVLLLVVAGARLTNADPERRARLHSVHARTVLEHTCVFWRMTVLQIRARITQAVRPAGAAHSVRRAVLNTIEGVR